MDQRGRLAVHNATADTLADCPPLDIRLDAKDRGVGMCTDVALYVLHAGGRLVPGGFAGSTYDRICGVRTARLFLETIYEDWLYSSVAGVRRIMLPK